MKTRIIILKPRVTATFAAVCVAALQCPRGRNVVMQEAVASATSKHFRLEDLRAELAVAVSEERYLEAASLRDELAMLESDEECAVLSANAQFYAVLRSRDPQAMDRCWLDGELAAASTRMYPGFPPCRGRREILQVWQETISDSTVRISDIRSVLLRGDASAVVTCTEQRWSELGDGDGHLKTVNAFEKGLDGRWRLAMHQAGPLVGADADSLLGQDYDEELEGFDEDVPGATG